MTAVFISILSGVMSIIVMLSGMFPALFEGKVYIDPDGNKVTVVDDVDIGDDALVIKDYESFKALGDIGVSYDEKFFETNSLAVFTKEYHCEDEFCLVSVSVRDGKYMDVKYYVDDKSLATWYSPVFKTVVIEASKDLISIRPSRVEEINFVKLYKDIFEN